MELEIPSVEEPVAILRYFPLSISDVDNLFYTINVSKLFCFGRREVKFMYSGQMIRRKLMTWCQTDTCFHVKVHGKSKEEWVP